MSLGENVSVQKELIAIFHYWRRVDSDFKDISSRARKICELSEKLSVIPLTLDVNIPELLDVDAALGNMVLYDPSMASRLFQKVLSHGYILRMWKLPSTLSVLPENVKNDTMTNNPLVLHSGQFLFIALRALKVLPDNIELSQIHTVIKIRDVPPIPWHIITDKTSLCESIKSRGPCVFQCKITEISCLMKYTQIACYFCPINGCEGSYGFKYVRIHIPGAAEQTTVGQSFTCTVCGSTLNEEKAFRRLSDKRILHVILRDIQPANDDVSNMAAVAQRLRVICRDEEARQYSIGEEINVTGRLVYDTLISKQTHIIVEANVVEAVPISGSPTNPRPKFIPESISQLLQDRADSRWSFALVMSYLCAETVAPAGTFVKLKLALLLSLLSTHPHKLNIMCIGKETLLLNRLLYYFSSLCEGSVRHTASSALFGETRQDKHTTADFFISGGSCLLANSSVCVIPDVCAISKQEEANILRALEYHTVMLPVQGVADPVCVDVKARLWACSESHSLDRKSGSKSLSKRSVNPALIHLFDLILVTDDLTSDYQEQIALATLVRSIDCGPDHQGTTGRVPHPDLRQYLEMCKELNVTFPEEIKSYLARFYLTSRQVRADINAMPTSSLRTMLTIAESHARLSYRSTVLIEDALAAILLYEECLTSIHHHSVVSVSHEPHWKDSVTDYYLTQQNDEGMALLKTSVDNFCKLHCTSELSALSEE